MLEKNKSHAARNVGLRQLLLDNFNAIRPLTSEEVEDEFLIWDRARKLFPGLEETLEAPEFVLLKDNIVVAAQTIGFEYRATDVVRALTEEEALACVTNEYKEVFCLSRLDVHVMDVTVMLIDPQKGHKRYYPKNPYQSSGEHARDWRSRTTQYGTI